MRRRESVFKGTPQKVNGLKIPDCNIFEFSSGKELLNNFVKGMYEVIILDVEMLELNGLQTAERIRQVEKSVIISFLTNYAEFVVKGYEVEAFRHILKNQPDYLFIQQLASVFEECNQRFEKYKFSNRNLSFKFRLIDILYFEVHGRKVTVFTSTSEIEYYGDFAEICEELREFNFIKCN